MSAQAKTPRSSEVKTALGTYPNSPTRCATQEPAATGHVPVCHPQLGGYRRTHQDLNWDRWIQSLMRWQHVHGTGGRGTLLLQKTVKIKTRFTVHATMNVSVTPGCSRNEGAIATRLAGCVPEKRRKV